MIKRPKADEFERKKFYREGRAPFPRPIKKNAQKKLLRRQQTFARR